jgi:hypothetical protein
LGLKLTIFFRKTNTGTRIFFRAHEISPLDDQENRCGFYKGTYFGKKNPQIHQISRKKMVEITII